MKRFKGGIWSKTAFYFFLFSKLGSHYLTLTSGFPLHTFSVPVKMFVPTYPTSIQACLPFFSWRLPPSPVLSWTVTPANSRTSPAAFPHTFRYSHESPTPRPFSGPLWRLWGGIASRKDSSVFPKESMKRNGHFHN